MHSTPLNSKISTEAFPNSTSWALVKHVPKITTLSMGSDILDSYVLNHFENVFV